MNVLAVIPARGGSKGIPRKNLRLLGGKPLIYYAIQTALASRHDLDVYVSSDDAEILTMAEQFGAKPHRRDPAIADDSTTLDPVIYACYQEAQRIEDKTYDLIITMQPTSPLLKSNTLDAAIDRLVEEPSIETVIAAKDDTHLSWRKEHGKFLPNYEKRLNRQYLTPTFTETGGFFISRKEVVSENNRIGTNVELHVLSHGEEIDIDTYEDWNLCEYHLKRQHILFVVTGNSQVGLGHVYNTLLIANDILDHEITFLVDGDSRLAFDKIASKNYPVHIQQHEDILDDIRAINPDLVINDRLDTTAAYMEGLKSLGIKAANFEDLGAGARYADLVINAIYPEKQVLPNHYFGHDYFILRDEFIYTEPKVIGESVEEVLITFGGVDPNNYTQKSIAAIYDYCRRHGIKITVIAGFGYDKYETLEAFEEIEVQSNVSNISCFIRRADLIFTSAGRTTYEIASIGTPAIVLVQNEREMTHFFASSEFGFANLGLGYELSDAQIYEQFVTLVTSMENRAYMSALMQKSDLKSGRKTVNKLLRNLLEEENK
jgi:CMP-N-acetylneuraminic acid synthetase/spore coat polysaccharide biosynthesis predicted glycosyltransferase SpsG